VPKVGLTDLEKRRRAVLACIASKKVLNGWDDKRMAIKAQVSPTTYERRKEAPEDFSLKELWGMGLTIYIYDGQSQLPSDSGFVELRG
jgi:hypothetical protein